METTAIVTSPNIEGNISTCQILSQQVGIIRENWHSFSQKDQWQSFNTCTGAVVKEYEVPEINLWPIPIIFIFVFSFIAIFSLAVLLKE